MLSYIKRQYKNESRLPLDLRTPIMHIPSFSLENFKFAEQMFVQDELISKIFRKTKYTKSNLLTGLTGRKVQRFHKLRVGSFVAVLLMSKTVLISYSKASRKLLKRSTFISGDSTIITSKFRGFFGHCIKKINAKASSSLVLRIHLLGCVFLVKLNIFSPNVLTLFTIPRLWKKKNKKKFRIFRDLPKKVYSSSISFKLKKIRKKKDLSLLKAHQ